jgi:hypothetical protein
MTRVSGVSVRAQTCSLCLHEQKMLTNASK